MRHEQNGRPTWPATKVSKYFPGTVLSLRYDNFGRALEDIVLAGHRRLQRAKRPKLHAGAILIELIRSVVEVRFDRRIPFDFGAAVSGFAANDRSEGAIGDLMGFIHRG